MSLATAMYVLDFINSVRDAQSCAGLERLPGPGEDGSSPLELAMGCRLEPGMMRLSSPQAAAAVAEATGLPVGADRMTIALPEALRSVAGALNATRFGAAALCSSGPR